MFIMEFYKNAAKVGWRCIYSNSAPILTKGGRPSTCGIIVTGDEVLKGQVQDTNSYFLRKNLYEMGIKVMAVSTIRDQVDVISTEVKKFSNMYDYVLTTGGIGPTHDDVTYDAVAKAFDEELFIHPELAEMVLTFYKSVDKNHPALKMARIPESGRLTYGYNAVTKTKTSFPNISVKNVYMFPGIPELCERLFSLTKDQMFINKGKFHVRQLYLTHNEGEIAKDLQRAVEKYPNVMFGSYPKWFHSYYTVRISMESLEMSEVDDAFSFLKNAIPEKYQLEYDTNPFADKMSKINKRKDKLLTEAINILIEGIGPKNPNKFFLYFDGGKNSTIILYILSAVYEKLYPNFKINAVYVERNAKITPFVLECLKYYNLNLIKLDSDNFKYMATCTDLLSIVKGTRKTDPNAEAIFKYFKPVSIINPLYNWTYNDVWRNIRGFCLPYCKLYDQGYSSICHSDAVRNSHLIVRGARPDLVLYKKAYELQDESLENSD